MQRRGITLIEVLFSIGIIAVGLLGVMAVLPVALRQVGRGYVADRASRAGQNAIHEFSTRDMSNPNRWVIRDPSTGSYTSPSATGTGLSALPTGNGLSYAIDPLMFATYSKNTTAATVLSAYTFPYNAASLGTPPPYMYRISLMPQNSTRPSPPDYLSLPDSDRLFIVPDDLLFDIPAEKSLPPLQQYGDTEQSPAPVIKRRNQGDFSWMATITPKVQIGRTSSVWKDTYILSIVVFHKRDYAFTLNTTNERIATVASFPGGGYGGGDVEIEGASAEELDVKANDWIMLAGSVDVDTSSSTSLVSLFRWYRVVDAAAEPEATGATPAWQNFVYLQGPDWPTASISGSTSAYLVANVAAVYEREIRLGECAYPPNY